MQSLASLLTARVEAAAGIDPEMRPATKPQFGHFQSNVALRLAKHLLGVPGPRAGRPQSAAQRQDQRGHHRQQRQQHRRGPPPQGPASPATESKRR